MTHLLSTRSTLAPLLLAIALTGLAGCKPATTETAATGTAPAAAAAATSLDPQLANPQVGDLWAAELTHFSGGEFGEGRQTREDAFGLMKVVEVQPDQIVLITEEGAWPKKQGAINDLRGDLAEVSWDEEEKITLKNTELAGLVADGRILETRRLAQ
ncbi:hypothetical protein [Xanthomonas sp. XNM01]|mgnify:CR=1 FL=1|uniref:hypothetical protein n=1 Tax=Xanthomonas sp. XNM01 TaxID=2769289 RepID=UPI001784DDD1|nr:hypothetical protein [Xanthomonas sp. XNM01]MBD9370029.1 hypothetical protein [Xanthomonas sp. XNM01]